MIVKEINKGERKPLSLSTKRLFIQITSSSNFCPQLLKPEFFLREYNCYGYFYPCVTDDRQSKYSIICILLHKYKQFVINEHKQNKVCSFQSVFLVDIYKDSRQIFIIRCRLSLKSYYSTLWRFLTTFNELTDI